MPKKSIDTIAKEVLNNKWGVGLHRKKKLEKAGYNYEKVQNRVNELYHAGSTEDKNISSNGVALIKSFEGFCRVACKALPTEKYYTIGFGHYGADVKENQTITKDEAVKLLVKDLAGFVAKVNKYNRKYGFTQNEFDALVSFCYNVGNIDGITKNGTRTKAQIADKFLAYAYSGGKYVQGLYNRRLKERALFNKKDK
ncbi:glycoside hydrolase family protein [Megamonas funiformis]|uniref:glycoside hydrolase family protein n=1 Tax=Megamonas funiformis TaxID=437897 RepID=UPI002675DBDF|nr:glycoside hydrolase family protein [Megamonas funiformis]